MSLIDTSDWLPEINSLSILYKRKSERLFIYFVYLDIFCEKSRFDFVLSISNRPISWIFYAGLVTFAAYGLRPVPRHRYSYSTY